MQGYVSSCQNPHLSWFLDRVDRGFSCILTSFKKVPFRATYYQSFASFVCPSNLQVTCLSFKTWRLVHGNGLQTDCTVASLQLVSFRSWTSKNNMSTYFDHLKIEDWNSKMNVNVWLILAACQGTVMTSTCAVPSAPKAPKAASCS